MLPKKREVASGICENVQDFDQNNVGSISKDPFGSVRDPGLFLVTSQRNFTHVRSDRSDRSDRTFGLCLHQTRGSSMDGIGSELPMIRRLVA